MHISQKPVPAEKPQGRENNLFGTTAKGKTPGRHGRGHIHNGMSAWRRFHRYAGIIVYQLIAAGVDHHGFVIGIDGTSIHGVLPQMAVTVKMDGGLIHVIDVPEGLEALVKQIGAIAKTQRRGMGHKQVDALIPTDMRLQFLDFPPHLFIRIFI